MEGDDVGDAGPPLSQRSRLVEGDEPGLGGGRDCHAALHQQALAGAGRERGGDRGGNRDDQCAGAADQQQGKAPVNPSIPGLAKGEGRHKNHQRRNRDAGGQVPTAEAVDETFGRRACLRRPAATRVYRY